VKGSFIIIVIRLKTESIRKTTLVINFVAQSTAACPTAIWNNTFKVIAGVSGIAGSTATALYYPIDCYFGPNSTLYVSDNYNNRIQKFFNGSATATTVSLTNITLSYPSGIVVDNTGAIYVSDTNNYRVVRLSNNIATVVAGGHGSGASLTQISTCYFIYVDASSNIYVSDYGAHRVTFWTAGNSNISQLVLFFYSKKIISKILL
jgi:sugar lactone lactonase YvrE